MEKISKTATVTIELILWNDLLEYTDYDETHLDLIVKNLLKGEFKPIKTASDMHTSPISVTNVEISNISDYWTQE